MKQRNWFGRHKILTVVGVIVLLAIIGGAAGGGNKSTNSSTDSSSTASKIEPTATPKPTVAAEPKQPAVPAEYKSALSQAYQYSSTAHLSKRGLYDQLVSEYGGKFTAAAAQYAIDNVKVDWNANALAQAKQYQETAHLSPAANHDQLTSEYGGKFTQAEADYAIQHL